MPPLWGTELVVLGNAAISDVEQLEGFAVGRKSKSQDRIPKRVGGVSWTARVLLLDIQSRTVDHAIDPTTALLIEYERSVGSESNLAG